MASFSEILNSIDPEQDIASLEDKAPKSQFPPKPEPDALLLSVRAQRALNAGRSGQKNAAREKREEYKDRLDAQGNKVRISTLGEVLAAPQAKSAAWETKRWHPNDEFLSKS